jgi:hypothetical protein
MFWICWRRSCRSDCQQNLHLFLVWPWGTASKHLEHCTAKTPNVSKSTVTSLLYHFWCHPVRRATKRPAFPVKLLFRATKVSKLASSIFFDQNICPLDISVDNIISMKVFDSLKNLTCVNGYHMLAHWVVAFVDLFQSTGAYKLKEHIQKILFSHWAKVPHDVFVFKFFQKFYFLLQCSYFLILKFAVAAEGGDGNLLYCHRESIGLVESKIHPAKGPLTYLLIDSEFFYFFSAQVGPHFFD